MKRVNFKKITIKNFLSIGETPVEVEFDKGLHILTGANRDKPERTNGVGKSAILCGIYFAIFGETLRDIKKELIVNNITGGKTQVELEFDVVSPQGNHSYHIIRTLSPTKVQIYQDGVDKTRDSISNTTKYICDILNASPAVFQNCVIMTVNNAVPFMAKNKIEKRKFIEDIFGMEVFSKMISVLRAEYNDIKKEFDIQSTKYNEVLKSYNDFKIQKDKSLEKRIDKRNLYIERQTNNDREIKTLEEQCAHTIDNDIINLQVEIKSLEQKVIVCDNKINRLVEEKGSKVTTLNHKRAEYKKIGTGEDSCPVCLRSIEEHDKDAINREKEKIDTEINTLTQEVTSVLNKMQEVTTLKDRVKKLIQRKNKDLNEANIQLQSKANIQDRLMQLKTWQIELVHDIQELSSDKTEFDELLNSTETRLVDLEKQVADITKKLSKLDIVKFVVSEEGVKSYIVNKLLELLNSKLFYYLKKLDSNSVCVFNEYFEEEIVNDKGKICSYFNFSGAERKSIDLACLFAFSDMRRVQGGVSYNIALYDELFDSSFDAKGIELITEILRERVDMLDECSIVVSHRKESLKSVTGDIIFLEKKNGITQRIASADE